MCLFLQKAYKQIDNYYINQIFSERMKKRFVLLLACLLAGIGLAIAQTPKTITGVVISEEDNQPVVGASVLVKGTAIGTTTNVDGKFTISNVPSSARTKSIGYPLSSQLYTKRSSPDSFLRGRLFLLKKTMGIPI